MQEPPATLYIRGVVIKGEQRQARRIKGRPGMTKAGRQAAHVKGKQKQAGSIACKPSQPCVLHQSHVAAGMPVRLRHAMPRRHMQPSRPAHTSSSATHCHNTPTSAAPISTSHLPQLKQPIGPENFWATACCCAAPRSMLRRCSRQKAQHSRAAPHPAAPAGSSCRNDGSSRAARCCCWCCSEAWPPHKAGSQATAPSATTPAASSSSAAVRASAAERCCRPVPCCCWLDCSDCLAGAGVVGCCCIRLRQGGLRPSHILVRSSVALL
jgi:hypothetical protein